MRVAVLGAAVAAVVMAAAAIAPTVGGRRAELQVTGPDGPAGRTATEAASDRATVWTTPRPGLWRVLPGVPLTPRIAHTMVAVGDRVAIWGGFDVAGLPLTDGALFDPSDGTWSLLPGTDIDDGTVTHAASTGDDLVLVSRDATHRFDPPSGAWTTLRRPPLPADHVLTAPATGGGGLVVATALPRGAPGARPAMAVLDARTWQRLPPPPVRFAPGDLVATDGSRVLIVTRAVLGRRAAVVTYDVARPTRGWQRAPVPDLLHDPTLLRVVGAIDGDRLVVAGIGPPGEASSAAVFDGARWHATPPLPLPTSWQIDGLWTGHGLLVWDGLTALGAHLDVTSRRWERLPPVPIATGPPRPATWVGSDLVTWGGFDPVGALLRHP